MPKYRITDPTSGRTVTISGDAPPDESALRQIFAEVGSPPPTDFSAGQMVRNVPGSAYKYGSDILGAVLNPIDTAKALGGLVQSGANKLGRKAAELTTGQQFEPDPRFSEDAANAVGGAIRDRYGSLDALQNTAMNDPVGMLADVSGLGMASRIPGVARVAAAVEPVNALAKGTKAVARAVIPEDAAVKLYQSAAKFSTTLTPKQRKAMVQTALENGIMPTSRGVAKVQDRIDILNVQLDDMIDAATAQGKSVPVTAVERHLHELRKSKGGVRLGAESDLAAIDKIAGEFQDYMTKMGKTSLTPEELQKFKVEAYKDINWNAKRQTGTPVGEDTYKAMARGAKDAIVDQIPDAADINKLLGNLYELQPHLSRAATRIDNRNLLSINAPLNTGAGGVLGSAADMTGVGAAAGALFSVLGNPKIKARVAIALNKIRAGDTKWLEANAGAAETRVALALAGRAQELVPYDPYANPETQQ